MSRIGLPTNRIFIRSLAALIVLVCLAPVTLRAQRFAGDSRSYFDYGEQFYSGAFLSADSRWIDVRLTMASAMFSFVRCESARELERGAYYAVRDVSIELTEKGSPMPVSSKSLRDTIFVRTFEETTAKTLWHAEMLPLSVPVYDAVKHLSLKIEVRDGILSRLSIRPITTDITIFGWHGQHTQINSTQPNDSLELGLSSISLFHRNLEGASFTSARGNTYPFSTPIHGSFTIAAPSMEQKVFDKNLHAVVTLTQLSSIADPADTIPRELERVTLSSKDFSGHTELLFDHADSELQYNVSKANNDYIELGQFLIPGRKFEQGRYRITVAVEAGDDNGHVWKRTTSSEIALVWENMPISLDDPRDAINPMTHLLTESEFKDMQSGSRTEMIRKLYNYWKKQDPTSETAFNERMATFYQRVDYADLNFATGHALDGAMTERGKIYILFGAPTKIERTLLPGESPIEVWTYLNNVKKIFRFTDPSNRGEYKLIEIKNL
jgi:GWxTD domain-containing protein